MSIATLQLEKITIANGASLSDAVACNSRSLVGIIMPAAWTAAGLTFQAGGFTAPGLSVGSFANIHNSAGELAYTVDASLYIAVDTLDFLGAQQVKVRSGTAGTPVNQGAARELYLVFRAFA